MDPATHAVFGALASRAVCPFPATGGKHDVGRYTPLAITTVAATLPDIDYLLFPLDPLTFLADWHRTYTNSVVLLPLWTVFLAGIIALIFPRLRRHWLLIGGLVALGIASHILLDLLTVYGTRIFFPLSSEKFSFGTTFLIDPWLSLIVFLGLVLSFFRAPRLVALTSIALASGYVLFQWHLKTEQEQVWNRAGYDETVILPQPYSPFHFRIIQRDGGHYRTALVDLLGVSEKTGRWAGAIPFIEQVSAFRSAGNVQWESWSLFGETPEQQSLAREAWNHGAMAPYRDFALYPVLYRIDMNDGETCIWFSDLRYHISIMTPSFRFGMCRNGEKGNWKRYRLRYFSEQRDQ